jgi:uncharacterized membrane protein YciS (DUF1049 family)
MRGLLQLLLVIIILVIASAFAALNEQVINLNYFIGLVETRLTFVIIFSFALGALFCFLIMMTFFIKVRLEKRRLQRALRLKDQELINLRELPVKDNY